MSRNEKLASSGRVFAGTLTLLFAIAGSGHETWSRQSQTKLQRVLVFSKAGWYRHPEIPRTNGWLVELGAQSGFKVSVSESPEDLNPKALAEYQVLLINNANAMGETLNDKQRQAIVDWYRKGGGIVGLHAALVHQK
ncbi:MAG TPA: ThuA domain-containing protein, partial [Planctomycetota bacterium]|nr:ThuA domain-containing protein [Planctomycetota bacterium]